MNRATSLLVAASFAAAKPTPIARALRICAVAIIAIGVLLTDKAAATIYYDAQGDVSSGLGTTFSGTLDIVSLEVTRNASTGILTFKFIVNGNISSDNSAKLMIGIDDPSWGYALTGNGWGRPIDLILPSYSGGMTHWIGCWVDSGGGAQLWVADQSTQGWLRVDGDAGNYGGSMTISLAPGAQSTVTITVPDYWFNSPSFSFDAYSSGPYDSDSAADALSNANPSIKVWTDRYISNQQTGYSFFYPPPSSYSLTLSCFSSSGPFFGASATATDMSSGSVLSAASGQTNTLSFPAGRSVRIGLSGAINGDVARWFVWDSVSGQRTTNYSFNYLNFGALDLLSMNRDYKVDVSVVGYAYWVWAETSGSSLPSDRRGWTNRNGPLNLPNGLNYAMGFGPTSARAGDLPFLVGAPAAGSNTVKFRYFEGRSPSGYYPLVADGPQIYAATNLAGPWTNANVLSKTNLAAPSASTPVEATVGVPAGASNFFLRLQAVGF